MRIRKIKEAFLELSTLHKFRPRCLMKISLLNLRGQNKHKRNEEEAISLQSLKMLSARAALKEKLKPKGIFTTLDSNCQRTQKHKVQRHSRYWVMKIGHWKMILEKGGGSMSFIVIGQGKFAYGVAHIGTCLWFMMLLQISFVKQCFLGVALPGVCKCKYRHRSCWDLKPMVEIQ